MAMVNTLAYYYVATIMSPGLVLHNFLRTQAGSATSNGREPKSCLGRVFNSKLGSFTLVYINISARHFVIMS
jgi:hypothetical protein